MMELKASFKGPAEGVILDSKLDKGKGCVTIEKKQEILCANHIGYIKRGGRRK